MTLSEVRAMKSHITLGLTTRYNNHIIVRSVNRSLLKNRPRTCLSKVPLDQMSTHTSPHYPKKQNFRPTESTQCISPPPVPKWTHIPIIGLPLSPPRHEKNITVHALFPILNTLCRPPCHYSHYHCVKWIFGLFPILGLLTWKNRMPTSGHFKVLKLSNEL